MAGLQRSTTSFRRQGSSGLVWEGRFPSDEITHQQQEQQQEQQQDHSAGGGGENREKGSELRRARSDGGRSMATPRAYRAVKVAGVEDPPSPKVAACGCCGAFVKSK